MYFAKLAFIVSFRLFTFPPDTSTVYNIAAFIRLVPWVRESYVEIAFKDSIPLYLNKI